LVDKFGSKDSRYYLWIPATSFIISFPFAIGLLFSHTLLQELVTVQMRATASAIFLMVISLFGTGTGPILAGAISDWLEPMYGVDSIRWALFYIGFLEVIAFFALLKAATTLKTDLA